MGPELVIVDHVYHHLVGELINAVERGAHGQIVLVRQNRSTLPLVCGRYGRV